LSSSDVSDAEKIVKSKGEELQVALVQQDVKMRNHQATVLNVIRGMTAEKHVQNIHTMESVMGAYESFADQITNDKESGVPIGFNYTVLTKEEIEKHIARLEKAFSQGSGSSAQEAGK
jgi:hypothetical protein